MTVMNNYPNLDVEEANIQEAIAQFYSFFGRMTQLRNNIEGLALDFHMKNRILDQLEDIESELNLSMFVCLRVVECVGGFTYIQLPGADLWSIVCYEERVCVVFTDGC